MRERIIFREMLSEIKALADERGSCLKVEEVQDFFRNAHLNEEQMKLVYEYLISQKIQVAGYAPGDSNESGSKEPVCQAQKSPAEETKAGGTWEDRDEYVQMYLQDLESILPADEDEEHDLFVRAAQGDSLAKSRIVELHLRTVYEVAQTYRMGELPLGDLIQEGNVALMMAVDQLSVMEDLDAYRSWIYRAVSEAMEEAVSEQQDMRQMDEEIAGRVTHLNEAVKNLERDLEHKVTLEELSAYLEMPVEEIKDILRMAGDEIEVQGQKNWKEQ